MWWRWRNGFCKHFYLWHWRNWNNSDRTVLFMKHKVQGRGLNNLGQPPFLDSASGMGGAGGGTLAGYGVGSSTSTNTGATNGTYGSGGGGAFGGATNQLNG